MSDTEDAANAAAETADTQALADAEQSHKFLEDNISQKDNITDVPNTAHVSLLSDRKACNPEVSDEISSQEPEIKTQQLNSQHLPSTITKTIIVENNQQWAPQTVDPSNNGFLQQWVPPKGPVQG